jgi:hypothetical protein
MPGGHGIMVGLIDDLKSYLNCMKKCSKKDALGIRMSRD